MEAWQIFSADNLIFIAGNITILFLALHFGEKLAQLIKPSSVKVVSQEGEVKVTIALELTINLNSDGLKVSASSEVGKVEKQKDSEDKVLWEIPDFGPVPKLGFGKKD